MYKKNNGRTTYKSSRRPIYKKSGGYQNYKGRNKGNVSQQYNKYLKLAKEAFRSGDRVQSEYYYQFTDHYYRIMVDLGINVEENLQSDEPKETLSNDQTTQNTNITSDDEDENSEDSIESISFIAEPSKEKRTKSTK